MGEAFGSRALVVAEELAGFFEQNGNGNVAILDHLFGDEEFLDLFVAGDVVHDIEHEFFEDHA